MSDTIMTQFELSENLDSPTLFQPLAEKEKMKGQVIRYSGENYLTDILTYILFMAIDMEESTKFTNGQA
ncbi:18064_t:CDS:2 [Cetraspora pellucida]|uniref:18064_t:CDS:1 n=1 Tax=Cetraspora pellucida TaxID=1433469 RepID=A0ACA9L2D9_9GLOM|nr:18064_t:CDS:2 [Cetraspora pellucida]